MERVYLLTSLMITTKNGLKVSLFSLRQQSS